MFKAFSTNDVEKAQDFVRPGSGTNLDEEAMNQSNSQLPRYAFIRATWHPEIVNRAYEAFSAEMGRQGVPEASIELFEVPGAFEIPLQAKLLARTGRYSAIVASAFVVNGGIYRHDFVASAVVSGLMTVQLETEVPVISVVLTPHHFHEHHVHEAFFLEHFRTKGVEAALACVKAVEGVQRIRAAA